MSSPKFLVFKLKDLKIPALILLIAVALFIFFIFKNKASQTFAPSTGYQDGKYIAGITLSDAQLDVVVEVTDNNISSVSLSGLDETSSALYKDLVSSVDYINSYVTATQSLELPANSNSSTATLLLMDAVKLALSSEEGTSVTNTYERLDLTSDPLTDPAQGETLQQDSSAQEADIFVDEFQDEDFTADSTETAPMDQAANEAVSSEE